MKKLLMLGLVMLVATSAFAQDPGDMGVFFDQAGTATTACWPSFTQTNHFYAILFDTPGIAGYEFGLNIDPTIIIFNSAMVAGNGPINVGQAPSNWIVGTGNCVNGAGAVVLVDFTGGYFVSPVADLLVCVTPSSPASLTPAVPAYLTCASEILPMGVASNGQSIYPDGCGVLCPSSESPIATDETSWGSLKSAF